MTLFEAHGLSKRFGDQVVLEDITLSFAEGQLSGIMGPNGAGKTTCFNVLTGRYKPDRGHVTFAGEDITGLAPHEIARKGISRSFQIMNLFNEYSALDNVLVATPHVRRQGTAERRVSDIAQCHHGDVLAAIGENLAPRIVGKLERRLLHAGLCGRLGREQLQAGLVGGDRARQRLRLNRCCGIGENAELHEYVVVAAIDQDQITGLEAREARQVVVNLRCQRHGQRSAAGERVVPDTIHIGHA